MPRVDGMKGGQGKRWWDFESCTIKRRDEDTRSLHRMIFFSFCFLFYMFSRVHFSVQASRGMAFRLGHYKVCKYGNFLVLAVAQNELARWDRWWARNGMEVGRI